MGETLEHLRKLPIDAIEESVDATPAVACSEDELLHVLQDLAKAVDEKTYIPQTPTVENPALSDDYVFNTSDENMILKDLSKENFVAKVRDVGKGAEKRKKMGYPQEYLYIFKYPCKLIRRDSQESVVSSENVLIYIKVNDRKIPDEKVFVVSFHKNRPKKR
ncbi:MAG: hypothetical protein IJW37_08040 [Lachnospiraceae bacterium]|nr:hypothetical protein [Lachnospiraceae bacterium]